MASELAAPPPTQLAPADDMDTSEAHQAYEAPTINGDAHYENKATTELIDSAIDAPLDLHAEPTETAVDAKPTAVSSADPIPSGAVPVEHVTSGIQPVADFLPKDATNLSHPTPPPDEPLTTGATDVDVEMANVESDAQAPAAELESMSVQAEPSLVRPREDDGEDEPAAKRTRLDEESGSVPASGMAEAPSAVPSEAVTASILETVDEPAVDATGVSADALSPQPAPSAEPISEALSDDLTQSAAETAGHHEPGASLEDVKVEATQPETQPDAGLSDAPGESIEGGSAVVTETQVDAKPAATGDSQAQLASQPAPTASDKAMYSTEPMTAPQKNYLVDKVKNLKKTKHSGPFLRPVDPVALGIPTYLDIITQPMDITTLDAKLKKGAYGSVQDFANDFDLIIGNTRRFNGDAHAITQTGFLLEAYFRKMMENVPTASMAAPPKQEKKRSPSLPREKRRESRQVIPPVAPTASTPSAAASTAPASAADTYALQANGTPQIRRQSTNAGRPARAIKPTQNREISYAKPKRKAHQLELRFCEHVLNEMTGIQYGHLNHPFLVPVDPVALNIPHYHQVIRRPMDLGTMGTKLRLGEYGTAAEFKKDFDQVTKNCTQFNPPGNPIRDMAIALQREFEQLWAEKDKWERKNQPVSNRASSASADDDSVADDDEDEDDDDGDNKALTIRNLQKQLAEMQNALSGMTDIKAAKKKAKAKKAPTYEQRKVGTAAAPRAKAAKPAAKSKKSRVVTYEDKQEISEAVPRMSEAQVQQLTSIITDNSPRHRDMGEELELEIDDLPSNVQIMLLDFVRRIFGNPKKKARDASPDDAAALDDDDFEPARRASGAAGKRKKHKPMGKKEQQDAIKNLKGQLAQFQGATSGSESPTNSSFAVANAEADTSGDEASEESEEE
ncbi:transcription initiation at TATA-containing promoter protein [Extremus antarcticus]|uniref:Transcription initiation at TATA-containing promoter protein n=1 Tax=Extremus antarcticus TaxID=702011 RepID=A0AAJ0LV14_9PEZI|nr:transcription initiation at TATA-containing promoter protein [Extremus antarcticus]